MSVFRRFTGYLAPYSAHIVAVLACTTLFVAFSSAAYWLAASFIQALFTGGLSGVENPVSLNDQLKQWTALLLESPTPQGTLLRAAIAIVFAFFAKNLFGYLQLFYVSFVEQRVIKQLRDQLFGHFLRQDLAFFQRHRRGHLISAVLNDIETLNQALNKSFTKLIRDPINALVLLALLFTISWPLTLAALVVVPAVGWTVLLLGKMIKRYAAQVQETLARITGQLQETLSGIRIVKAFVNEAFERNRFFGLTGLLFRRSYSQERLRRLVIPLNEFIGVIIISAILYVGGELVLVKRVIDSEDFIRFLVLLFALLNPLLSLTNLTANIRLAEASGSRVFQILDESSQVTDKRGASKPGGFRKVLRLEGVCYRYNESEQDVLTDIRLVIKPGDRLTIVGKSGSGKTTLVNLLPRFFDPTAGSVRLDGIDLRELNLHGLRKLFGVVTQDVILFHDTVAVNIAYGLDGAETERIEEAAKAAFAHEFIAQLPRGYETIVGEQGALLSGGQRQRISIARALLRNPEIVILDEATSALDPESEQVVAAALKKLSSGRTVVSVTHRLAAARNADIIVVLDRGRIIDTGTHGELIKRCEVYHELARQQRLLESADPEPHDSGLRPEAARGQT